MHGQYVLRQLGAARVKITVGMLTLFFLPVAANAALMMLSHAVNTAGLGRVTNAAYVLASYALARAMVAFIEAPVLMLRQTTITLVRGQRDLRLIIRMTALLAVLLLAVQVTVVTTPLGRFVLQRIIGAPPHLWQGALSAFIYLAPLPILSGMRSIYQGILLYQRQPAIITLAMVARVLVMAGVVTVLVRLVPHWGSVIGSVTFMVGLGVEAAICIIYGRTTPVAQAAQADDGGLLEAKQIIAFSAPLTVLGLVDGVATGAITASLSRTAHPELAMAAYAVTWSLVAVLTGALQTVHQVILIFGKEEEAKPALRRFLIYVSGAGVLILLTLAFTPLGRLVFTYMLGVPLELVAESARSLMWFVPLPVLITVSDTCIGRLLAQHSSRLVAGAKIANMLTMILAAFFSSVWARGTGAATGPLMVLMASCVEMVVLATCWFFVKRRLPYLKTTIS